MSSIQPPRTATNPDPPTHSHRAPPTASSDAAAPFGPAPPTPGANRPLAIVALGSNLGNRTAMLRLALSRLHSDAGPIVAQSQVFETDPIGGPDQQGPFLNMVATLHTGLGPQALLACCLDIERTAGRLRLQHWGPRTLDIDVLFYDDVVLHSETLTLPHPRLGERRFVLTPLAEVAPARCPAGWQQRLPPAGVYPRGPLSLLTVP